MNFAMQKIEPEENTVNLDLLIHIVRYREIEPHSPCSIDLDQQQSEPLLNQQTEKDYTVV